MDEETILAEIRQRMATALKPIVGEPLEAQTLQRITTVTQQVLHDTRALEETIEPTVFTRIDPDDANKVNLIALTPDLSRYRVQHDGHEYHVLAVNQQDATILLDNQQRVSVWDPDYQLTWRPRPILRFDTGRLFSGVRALLGEHLNAIVTIWADEWHVRAELLQRMDKHVQTRANDNIARQVSQAVRAQVQSVVMTPVQQQVDHGWR